MYLETIKQDFTDLELRGLEVGERFFWSWLPANGHSGGLLMGVRDNLFEVGNMDSSLYFVSLDVLYRPSKPKYTLIIIYGPADHSNSAEFLDEISGKIARCHLPTIMGETLTLSEAAKTKTIPISIGPG